MSLRMSQSGLTDGRFHLSHHHHHHRRRRHRGTVIIGVIINVTFKRLRSCTYELLVNLLKSDLTMYQ